MHQAYKLHGYLGTWTQYSIVVSIFFSIISILTPIYYYSSFHFLFHYPHITPIYYSSFAGLLGSLEGVSKRRGGGDTLRRQGWPSSGWAQLSYVSYRQKGGGLQGLFRVLLGV